MAAWTGPRYGRRDRVPHRRAPCGVVPGRCRCAGASHHLDVRRAQHRGAADPRARDRQVRGGRQALGRRATSPGQGPHPRSAVQLLARLGDADWLDGAFSASDLMMVSVLLRLRPPGLLDEFPTLAAYVARVEARPAYERPFVAQRAITAADADV